MKGFLRPRVLTFRILTSRDSYIQGASIQGLLRPRVLNVQGFLHPGVLTFMSSTSRSSLMHFLRSGVFTSRYSYVKRFLRSRVLTTRGS